jgi:hypothetical protein
MGEAETENEIQLDLSKVVIKPQYEFRFISEKNSGCNVGACQVNGKTYHAVNFYADDVPFVQLILTPRISRQFGHLISHYIDESHRARDGETQAEVQAEKIVSKNIYFVDFENVGICAKKIFQYSNMNLQYSAIRQAVQRFFVKPYQAFWFTKDRDKFEALPENKYNHKYLETAKKTVDGLSMIMDIDTVLCGEAGKYIALNHDQIASVTLVAGDVDLKVVFDIAKEFGLPVALIATDSVSLNLQLRKMVMKEQLRFIFEEERLKALKGILNATNGVR